MPLGILAFQAWLRATGNFHEVVAGEFYRSAQPSPAALEEQIKRHGIKTLINLRGEQPMAGWYRDERRVAASNDVEMIDFGMAADHKLEPARARELVAMMKSAAKPILVHCRTGADRTGLVSVIYANVVAGVDDEEAERQLSPIYGHFGIPFFSGTYAMDESWEELKKMLGTAGP